MNKSLLSALLLLGSIWLARAQDPDIRHAFPTKDGFVAVGSGGDNVVQVWSSKDGRKFEAVHQCKGWLHDAAMVGQRLVVTTFSEGLYVIALDGSWKVEHTPVKDDYVAALASNGREALVLTANKQQWRLGAEGKWTTQPFRFPYNHHATRLIFGHGVWVAAGSDRNQDPNTGKGPTPVAWSADGQKWEKAEIKSSNAGGVHALAVSKQAFLALTATGQGLVSSDGKVWQPASLPPLPDEDDAYELFSAGGKFWLVSHGPYRLRSSVDGKTWSSPDVLPTGLQLHFLVEKGDQAWIFGTNGDRFGVIARADQLGEPDSPESVAVAGSTQSKPTALPAPVAITIPDVQASPGSEMLALKELALPADQPLNLGLIRRIRPSSRGWFFTGQHGLAEGPRIDLAAPALSHNFRGWVMDVIELPDGTVGVLRADRLQVTSRTRQEIREVTPPNRLADMKEIAALPNGMIAVGSYGTILGWVNGAPRHWTTPAPLYLFAVAAGNDIAIAIESNDRGEPNGGYLIQGDQVEPLKPLLGVEGATLSDITFTGSEFVIVGANGLVLRSSDGRAWRAYDIEGKPDLRQVHHVAGWIYVTTADLRILASSDFLRWMPVVTGADRRKISWEGMAEDQGRPVAYTAKCELLRLPANPAPVAGAPVLTAVDRAEAARQMAEAKRQKAEQRARPLAQLKQDLAQKKLPLAQLALLKKFVSQHGDFAREEADSLAPVLMSDFTPAKGYLFAVGVSDHLGGAILRQCTPQQKTAVQAMARAVSGRTPSTIKRPPSLDLAAIKTPTTASFDVAWMEKQASDRNTRDKSYIGAAYDMAAAYGEGWGVFRDTNRGSNYFQIAVNGGIRYQPEPGEEGYGAPLDLNQVNLNVAARYRSVVAAYEYAQHLEKQGQTDEAMRWLREAALRTHYTSAHNAAVAILVRGDLRPGTVEEAFEWLERGARAGHAESLSLLGFAVLHGLGVPADTATARSLLEKSAALGSAQGAELLASLNAWEKERAAKWEEIYQEQKAVNEIFANLNRALSESAAQLEEANKTYLAQVQAAPSNTPSNTTAHSSPSGPTAGTDAAPSSRQPTDVFFAFSTAEGFIALGPGEVKQTVEVWFSKDGRNFETVKSLQGWLKDALVVGRRLVLVTSMPNQLMAISLDGSWRVESTHNYYAGSPDLAASEKEVMGVSSSEVFILKEDGSWTKHSVNFPDKYYPTKAAFKNGVWIAAGSLLGTSIYKPGPTWILWSADGKAWEPAKIEAPNACGLLGLVVHNNRFFALTWGNDGLTSTDGKVWQPLKFPEFSYPESVYDLFLATGRFWLLESAGLYYPQRVRSSVDGQTWTPAQTLSKDQIARFILEKDGQAWILGKERERFGVICRADQLR